MRALTLALLLSLCPALCHAECTTVRTGTVSLRPRTPLERAYYDAAVCYRRKWEDALSDVRTASIALAAERAVPPVPAESSSSVLTFALGVAAGLAAGALAACLLSR